MCTEENTQQTYPSIPDYRTTPIIKEINPWHLSALQVDPGQRRGPGKLRDVSGMSGRILAARYKDKHLISYGKL